MRKRTRYGQSLLLATAMSLVGCQLPSIVPKSNPGEPNGNPLVDSKGVNQPGHSIQTASGSAFVPKLFKSQAVEDVATPAFGSHTWVLPTSDTLDLYGRIDFPYYAGGNYAYSIYINDIPLNSGLSNKSGSGWSVLNTSVDPPVARWQLSYTPSFFTAYIYDGTTPWGAPRIVGITYNDLDSQWCRYIWNISHLSGNAATMSVRVFNDHTLPQKYDPSYAHPIFVRINPTPPKISLKLDVDTPIFSPNADGALDFATGSIKAQGPWKLSVVEHGEITTGTGNTPLSWDGTVNGVKLPDGEYTLRLEDANNPSSKAEVKVVIDTIAPDLQDAYISYVSAKLTDASRMEAVYTINAEAVDSSAAGFNTGIDNTSIEVEFAEISTTRQGAFEIVTEGTYKADYKYTGPVDKKYPELNYSVILKDKAGNSSRKLTRLYSSTIRTEFRISANERPNNGHNIRALTSLANSPFTVPITPSTVFYSQSGLLGEISISDKWKTNDPRQLGGSSVYSINKQSNLVPGQPKTYLTHPITFVANEPQAKTRTIHWDGQWHNPFTHHPSSGTFADDGIYRLDLFEPPGWTEVTKKSFDFKVSGLPFITKSDWTNEASASFLNLNPRKISDPYYQIAHFLDGHIVSSVQPKKELFGTYIPNLLITNFPRYNEHTDRNNSYTTTKKIIQSEPYKSVFAEACKITTAIWKNGIAIKPQDPAGRDVGYVYNMNNIILFRAISHHNGAVFHTAYPDWLGKLRYETNIK